MEHFVYITHVKYVYVLFISKLLSLCCGIKYSQNYNRYSRQEYKRPKFIFKLSKMKYSHNCSEYSKNSDNKMYI